MVKRSSLLLVLISAAAVVFAGCTGRSGTSVNPIATLDPANVRLGMTCAVEFPPVDTRRTGRGIIGVGFEPFCVAWTDIFQDETGYRITVTVENQRHTYRVAADTNEYYPPTSESPSSIRNLAVMVFAQTPRGEEQVNSF